MKEKVPKHFQRLPESIQRLLLLSVFWILCALLSDNDVFAQAPAHLHYGVEEGLPSNLVYCGIQDRRGLLWFGTDKGLACFDGTRFRTFGVKQGLTDPEVLNLMEDHSGRLWISSYRKKPCYRKNGRFVTEKQDSLLAKMRIQSVLWEFFSDDDQSVWLSGQAPDVLHLSDNQLQAREFDKGIVRPGRINGTLFFFGINSIYQQLPDGEIALIAEPEAPQRKDVNPFMGLCISGNRVLYAYSDKLILLEWSNGRFWEVERRPGPIGRAFTDRAGRFWVCSLAEGAVCFDNDKRDLSNPKYYFKGEKVTAMFDDRQGTYWFCTTNNGVYALPENVAVNFTKRNGFHSNNITALARSRDGQLLSGDDEGNLYECGRESGLNTTSFGSADGYNRVRRILPAPDGSRWIVTDEVLYHEHNHVRRSVNLNVSPKTALLQSGLLWCATSGALLTIDEKTLEINRVAQGRFTTLCEDGNSNLWAGTNEGILSQSDSFRVDWAERFPRLSGRVVAMERAGNDSLWIVTSEKGLMLVHLNIGRITRVDTVPESVSSQLENIQSIFAGSGGRLWLATNRGAYRLEPGWNLVRFDHNNGLANDDVNAVLAYGDTLWAATVSGLSRLLLRPSNETGDFPTFIVSAGYRIKDRTIRIQLLDSIYAEHRIVIPPDASLFEIALTGLDYRSRGSMHFECITRQKLPSWPWWTFDNLFEWIGNGLKEHADTTRVTTDNLSFGVKMSPGSYQMCITAITAGNIRSRHPDVWTLEMRPDRSDTVWFWLAVWTLLAYGVWRILRARNEYLKMDAAVSELQLQALQSQMNPHFVGNSINAIQQFFYPPDPIRASEYISLFTRLLRRTLSFSDKTFISFSEEKAYVRDYLEMMKLRFGDYFRYEISGEESIAPGTPFPCMLLQPILENATIHGLAPDGVSVIQLDFAKIDGQLECIITDNGAGMLATAERRRVSGSTHQSKGLEILQKKVETLNRRYGLGLTLDLHDLSDNNPPGRGTRAAIRFSPDKIPVRTPVSETATGSTRRIHKPSNPI